MAEIDSKRPLLPSVLDRLLDDEPEVRREAPASAHMVLRQLRTAVHRDLENLLNTRQRCLSWPVGLSEVERSPVAYGIPDFTGKSLGSTRSRDVFLRSIETIIKRNEPRFQSVKVTPLENPDPLDRTLHFRIDAVLHAEPVPESLVFDSRVEPVHRKFRLEL